MLNIDQKQLIKRYQTLVKPLQDIIFSDQTSDEIRKICVLREIEQHISIIAKFVGFVLLGYLRPELFALEIQKETGVDMQKAQLIAHDLDMEIFSAVRLELKKLYPPTIQTPTVQTWRAESQPTPAPSASSGQAKPRYVIPIPEKFLRQSADATKFNKPAGGDQVSQKTADQYGEVRPPTTNDLPQPQTQKATNSATTGGVQQAEVKPQEPPISPPAPTLKAKEANEAPSFKPIVPLPTFIQTQFRTTQVGSQKIAGDKSNMARSDLQQPVNEFTLGAYSKTNSFSGNFKSAGGGPTSERAEAKPQEPPISPPVPTLKANEANEANEAPSLADDPQIKNLISKFTSSGTQKPKPPAESPYREKI